MRKIYIVEDDESIRELIIYALESNSFEVEGFQTDCDFFNALDKEIPALVLLDVMLPGTDGFSILKKMRESKEYAQIPVIIVSARGGESDKVKGLNFGADDYVTKPFRVIELIARINAVLRRNQEHESELKTLLFKNISVDRKHHIVFVDGKKVLLTYKEYELLHYLILYADTVLSRDKIIKKVWGNDLASESRTVDMHVKTLRQKLNSAGKYIKTVRNVGYIIEE